MDLPRIFPSPALDHFSGWNGMEIDFSCLKMNPRLNRIAAILKFAYLLTS